VAIAADLSRPEDRERLVTEDAPEAEPPAVMAEAALMLCSAEPRTLTGRVAYSQDLLAELRGTTPSGR
jgi:citronellol/citronellal dehydrogenase